MRLYIWFSLLVGLGLFVSCQPASPIQLVGLKVEGKENPLGILHNNPSLSWRLESHARGAKQSAYQVLVASSTKKLANGDGDLWNSQKTMSDQSQGVSYKGTTPGPNSYAYWKVRIWDEKGQISKWSPPHRWAMGPGKNNDWAAKWISYRDHETSTERGFFATYGQKQDKNPQDTSAILFARKLELSKPVQHALVHLVGLGYFELYINGKRVGDEVMNPLFSDFQKHIYFSSYELKEYLFLGENEIRLRLGNGFYNLPTQDLFMMDQAHWKGPPKLIFQLHLTYEDGSQEVIMSDNKWMWRKDKWVYNSIRGGETYDDRIEVKSHEELKGKGYPSTWKPVREVPPPLGKLLPQAMPSMKVVDTLPALKIFEPSPGVFLVDFGENLTGWAELRIPSLPAGTAVKLFYNERLNKKGLLEKRYSGGHTRGRFQEGRFISAGKESVLKGHFTYHGFRYVQIEGLEQKPKLDDIQAFSVHTHLPESGHFDCSNDRLNDLQAATRRTLLNSVHSMPGEEPTREKMGWTFDGGMVTMESYLYNFQSISTYKKYLQDLIDAQEPNGHIPPIVPTNGWGFVDPSTNKPVLYDDPWWGSTIFFVAQKLYEWTGDTTLLEKSYEPMQRYLDFVAETADDSLFVHWSLGDWLDLKQWTKGWGPGLTPIVQTSTACHFWMNQQLAEISGLLGKTVEEKAFAKQAAKIKAHFNHRFLDKESGWYSDSSQTAQALPLFIDLVPEDMEQMVFERLKDAIKYNQFHTNTGFVGVQPLLKFLSENGEIELAYQMVTQEESPGWLHMLKNGDKSTLGENLNAKGYGTGHHPFATCIGHWFYQYLGGIQVGEDGLGWKNYVLRPGILPQLDEVHACFHSPYGQVLSNWKRMGDRIEYQVHIPSNTMATLVLPVPNSSDVFVAGKALDEVDFVKEYTSKGDSLMFQLEGGKYVITF